MPADARHEIRIIDADHKLGITAIVEAVSRLTLPFQHHPPESTPSLHPGFSPDTYSPDPSIMPSWKVSTLAPSSPPSTTFTFLDSPFSL